MDKETFTYSHAIVFNNKTFLVLKGSNTSIYLLEVKDGKVEYPQYEDYEAYLKMHSNQKKVFNIIGIKELKDRIFKLVPKVAFKNTLIAATAAMMMVGCKANADINTSTNNNGIPHTEYNYSVLQSASVSPGNSDFQKNVFQQVKTQLAQTGCEISDGGVDFNEMNNFYGLVHTYADGSIVCDDLDDFKKTLNITNQPTYDDVQKLIDDNANIPSDIKTILINIINKMRTEFPKLDLTVLNENYKDIKFIEKSDKEIQEIAGEGVYACYMDNENVVYYSHNHAEFSFEYIIAHEAIGHAANEYCRLKKINGKDVYVKFGSTITVIALDQNNSVEYVDLGFTIAEANADMIAFLTDEKVNNTSAYCAIHEYLNTLCKILGVGKDELLNMKGITLYKELAKKGVNNILSYQSDFDNYMCDYCQGLVVHGDHNVSKIIRNLLMDWKSNELTSEDSATIDKAVSDIETILYNPVYKRVIFGYKQSNGFNEFDYYDPSELADVFKTYQRNESKSK